MVLEEVPELDLGEQGQEKSSKEMHKREGKEVGKTRTPQAKREKYNRMRSRSRRMHLTPELYSHAHPWEVLKGARNAVKPSCEKTWVDCNQLGRDANKHVKKLLNLSPLLNYSGLEMSAVVKIVFSLLFRHASFRRQRESSFLQQRKWQDTTNKHDRQTGPKHNKKTQLTILSL